MQKIMLAGIGACLILAVIVLAVFSQADTQGFEPKVSSYEALFKETSYWVPNGKSLHSTRQCPTLARSQGIRSGNMYDASVEGKNDLCNVCWREEAVPNSTVANVGDGLLLYLTFTIVFGVPMLKQLENQKQQFLERTWMCDTPVNSWFIIKNTVLFGKFFTREFEMYRNEYVKIAIVTFCLLTRFCLKALFLPTWIVSIVLKKHARKDANSCLQKHADGHARTTDDYNNMQRLVGMHSQQKRYRFHCPTIDDYSRDVCPQRAAYCVQFCPVFSEQFPELLLTDEEEQAYYQQLEREPYRVVDIDEYDI